jgi:CrcB protein
MERGNSSGPWQKGTKPVGTYFNPSGFDRRFSAFGFLPRAACPESCQGTDLSMQRVLFVGVAGLVGTLARYWLSGWLDTTVGGTFPIGTLVVNLVGCFLAGFLFHALTEKYLVDPVLRVTVLVGFLGGFTTFSSYGIQSITLLRDREFFLAVLNIAASNLGGLTMVWLGYSLSKAV